MVQGRVERIWENERNGKPYWVLRIDGERYTVWNPEQLQGVEEGSLVVYEYKQSGRYRNITGLIPVRPAESAQPYVSERDLRVIRLSCLRSATQMLYNIEMNWEEKIKSTLDLAREFERYVIGEARQVKAEEAKLRDKQHLVRKR
jgi:hypothetical protein